MVPAAKDSVRGIRMGDSLAVFVGVRGCDAALLITVEDADRWGNATEPEEYVTG